MDELVITLPPLHVNDVNKILAGLGYLPMRDVLELTNIIKRAGDAQAAEFESKRKAANDEAGQKGDES